MINLLKKACELNLFNYLDIRFAMCLTKEKNPLLLLIFSLLSAANRLGDICLFIDKINSGNLFQGRENEMALKLWELAGTPNSNKIYCELKRSYAVSDAEKIEVKPLVLSKNKLYFQKMWFDEGLVADFFSENTLEKVDEIQLTKILNGLFLPSKIYNWQKIAIAVALTNRIAIISGGPGTGKTAIIAYLLATLVKLSHKKLIIKLAAPTGKAAFRVTETLNYALLNLNLSSKEYAVMPKRATTIHRLLGAQLNTQLLRYHKDNLLLLDVLIVDEASMINLSMMARLIEALPKHARVIFLGDKDQLSSVEAGAVLRDLCDSAKFGYSYKKVKQLMRITGYDLSEFILNDGSKIKDKICFLKKSYRFHSKSNIAQLATAVNQENIMSIRKLLSESRKDITFYPIKKSIQYNQLILDAVNFYNNYFNMIKSSLDYKDIFSIFNNYRLLSAVRDGPYGVVELNNQLEESLDRLGIIRLLDNTWKNYEGRPIIITKNDPSLELFNGDIGIILRDNKKALKAYFQLPNGSLKKISPHRLSNYETAFVMTVHKSQGSEFKHVALIIPPNVISIVNKQLIYTAITRAQKQITIYADKNVFIDSIMNTNKRCSGLTERLF
ncbi:exodeoxyribonuclease V subunit alpha [Arsenophonus symbiont of Ornithomya chloropus]|uniref:exodeoxyribonuclease V subunit alpha n=1 Tax=Arsenophonus symbiont of Ornithomya chloropus TaxID=634121 RepID=UPI0032B10802